MTKLKKGDKVKILSQSCFNNPNSCDGCKVFKELPYMVVETINGDRFGSVYITTEGRKKYKGHIGCSGFKEKDLKKVNQTIREMIED